MKFIKLEHFIEFAISVFIVTMFYRIDTHSSISVSSTCYPVSYLLRGWSILSTSGRLWHHPLVGCTPVKQKSLCADDSHRIFEEVYSSRQVTHLKDTTTLLSYWFLLHV